MSKTSEVKEIFSDLDDTIRDIDPVIAANVEESSVKIMTIVGDLETKLTLINLFTKILYEHELEDADAFIKMLFNKNGAGNENN